MSHNSIIDDVLSKEFKHARKPSTRELLGVKISIQRDHSKFYSKEFVPFTIQRDIRGRLIKKAPDSGYIQKYTTLWQLSKDINSNDTSLNQQPSNSKMSIIDTRFKLREVDHFRQTHLKSHQKSGSELSRQFQSIQNRDYSRKCKKVKEEQELWLTNGFKSVTLPIQHQTKNQQSIFRMTLKGQSISRKTPPKIIQSQSLKKIKLKPYSQHSGKRESHMSFFSKKPGRNPQLQEIEKHVKVHFNHPELERLRQSKKLQFKVVQNIQTGDKKFKDKIEEYRKIKQRIKREMAKY